LDWADVPSLNLDQYYNSAVWEKKQVSLDVWLGQTIRLRFVSHTTVGVSNSALFLDNIGIGGEVPEAPIPTSPINSDLVDELRPTLTVSNAFDFQSDPLSYRFEIYSDVDLTQLVAQVPAVAQGDGETSWQVDVNLTDHATFWWRSRADDGDDTGPWSEVGTFLVNEINNPPNVVNLEAPVNGGVLWSWQDTLVWRTVADPDPGDIILDYQIEIDNDPTFGSPVVSVEGIEVTGVPAGDGYLVGLTLEDLVGVDGIASGIWYWRVRARDSRFRYGDWSVPWVNFRMASDYERYIHELFTPEELMDALVSGPNADSDGDGIGQMIEFACGMDQAVNSRVGAPVHVVVDQAGEMHLAIEFNRRIGTDLVFALQHSEDLLQWANDQVSVEVLAAVDSEIERCRVVDPVARSGSARFIRLIVKTPE